MRGSMDGGEGDLESLGLYLLMGEPTLLLWEEDSDGDRERPTLLF